MVLIYNIGIRLYFIAILLASLWNKKARKWIAGRKASQNTKVVIKGNPIWFHCASVGEFEQALPLIHLYKTRNPEFSILITFFSPSGFEYGKLKMPNDYIRYLPLDTRQAMNKFVSQVRPAAVFIIKYEFWFHLLQQLHEKHIPTFLVSGIFRKEQWFFNRLGTLHRRMLGFFTHLFVQNEESRLLLNEIKVDKVSVMGDTRFDQVLHNKSTPLDDRQLEQFANSANIFIAGSVWDSDIPVLKKIIEILPPDWRIIIAPHEIDHFNTKFLKEPCGCYTNNENTQARILVLDVVGILSRVYRYANFVYVGGGFGKGIHNILEAAVYAKPIFIGPKYHKFAEAKELIQMECALEVNAENAADKVTQVVFNKKNYEGIQERLKSYLSANTNLSEKIWVFVKEYLSN